MNTVELLEKYKDLKPGDVIFMAALQEENYSDEMQYAFENNTPVVFVEEATKNGFYAYIQGDQSRTWFYRYKDIDYVASKCTTPDEKFLSELY